MEQQHHRLKTWPSSYTVILDGRKTFEVRPNQGYHVGDTIELIEHSINSGIPTGRTLTRTITYIAQPTAHVPLANGYVILALGTANAT